MQTNHSVSDYARRSSRRAALAGLVAARAPRHGQLTCPGNQTLVRIDEKICEAKPIAPARHRAGLLSRPSRKVHCRHSSTADRARRRAAAIEPCAEGERARGIATRVGTCGSGSWSRVCWRW